MSQAETVLRAVYIDGETKTGKGAASKAIADALNSQYNVYYDVAGDFYRRYVALVRQQLQLTEAADLPTGAVLQKAAEAVYAGRQAYDRNIDLGDLQRPAISTSVSLLGELPVAQRAGAEWFALSIERAAAESAEVIVLDGRNPRHRVEDELPNLTITVRTALDLYMTCEPAEAARRAWLNRGITNPSGEQIAAETEHVIERRTRDRNRVDRPFLQPSASVAYQPAEMDAKRAVRLSWQPEGVEKLPLAITIDNTNFELSNMLAAVIELAQEALSFSFQQ